MHRSAVCRRIVPLLGLLAVFSVRLPALAQESAPPTSSPEPGAALTVYLLTMGRGDQVWEKFGHNAIWIHDPVRGTDRVYNYGLFDFNSPGYWGRFAKGNWIYELGVSDIETTLYEYRYFNRSVVAQELNLTPAQKAELQAFLDWNASGDNRFYLYDYYRDNCSTRVRDVLDRVLDGRLRAATADSITGTTYRSHSERLLADEILVYSGLIAGLGPAADRPISAWEEMFLPAKVQEYVRTIRVPDASGNMVPLVTSERVMFQAARPAPPAAPPSWIPLYFAAGIAAGSLLVMLAGLAGRSRLARFAFGALSSLTALIIGTGGLLLVGLWAFTNHTIAHRNENLLQFDPVALILVALVPALAYGVRWAARPALWAAGAVAAISVLGFLIQLLPAFDQANGEIIALLLPLHVGLFWAVWRLNGSARLGAPEESASLEWDRKVPRRRESALKGAGSINR